MPSSKQALVEGIKSEFHSLYPDLTNVNQARNAFHWLCKIAEPLPWITSELTEEIDTLTNTFILDHEKQWIEATGMYNMTLAEALEIFDDGTCHGFEYKIENHKLYVREIL